MIARAREVDVAVIGGGPAGLASAATAAEAGARVVLVDRNPRPGGILNQCIHDGFGLHALGKSLTGPEFADRYVRRAIAAGVDVKSGTLVSSLSPERRLVCSTRGDRHELHAASVILAMGCRERTRGALRIPGTRPAGVYTAGAAQWLTNIANIRVGRRVAILGSGDIGLIMARRLTWEGVEVVCVIEKLPYPSGLPRNITQCLDEYEIPLLLSHTVTRIDGRDRVEGVAVSRVDGDGRPVGDEFELACDTLLLSVGLIPENELSRQAGVVLDPITGGAVVDSDLMTSVPGLFSCGNVLQIHDLADWAAEEGERAGRAAAAFADRRSDEPELKGACVAIIPGAGIRYVVPQTVAPRRGDTLLSFRVAEPKRDVMVEAWSGGEPIARLELPRAHPATMVQWRLDVGRASIEHALEVRLR
jgi:thioredoxin reductase